MTEFGRRDQPEERGGIAANVRSMSSSSRRVPRVTAAR